MADRVETLVNEMRACTRCADLPLGPRPLFQLAKAARILIVGQAPGRITHAKGRPFDDPSGDRLRNWLGVDRDQFYTDPRIGIFPMGLCFPGSGPGGDLPPRRECAATWREAVMQALERVELTLVLGRYAVAWHLPGLRKCSVADAVKACETGKDGYYVLPHPSPRNARWLRQHDWFEADIVPRVRTEVQRLLAD